MLAWLGVARRSDPFWIGGVCALAYLTRYNGIALIGAVLFALFVGGGRNRRRDVLRCLFGFALVASPWWIRNALVAGNPLFSLYRWGVYLSPVGRARNTETLLHMIAPDLGSPLAMHPIAKLRLLLPMLVLQWPPASANLAACAGLLLACWRRSPVALGHLLLAAATTGIVAIALPRGRYFVPLLPALLAIGAASWLRYGGRARGVGVALLLLAPVLPTWPPEAGDLAFFRAVLRAEPGRVSRSEAEPWVACLSPADLVVAERASDVVWKTGATTIWLTCSEADFWTIVERYPVDFARVTRRKDLLTPRFHAAFEPVPDCGPTLYRRRESGSGR